MKSSMSIQNVALRWISTKSDKDFNYIYNYLNPRIRSFLWKCYFSHSFNNISVVESQKDMDDVISNAWVRVFNSVSKYKEEFQFTTWIFTIAKNEARNFFKEKNRYSGFSIYQTGADVNDNEKGIDYLMFAKGMYEVNRDHIEEMEMDVLYNDIMKDINTNPKKIDIIIDREVNKLDYQTMSKKHEENVSTLKVIVHRNRNRLKDEYGDRYKKIITENI